MDRNINTKNLNIGQENYYIAIGIIFLGILCIIWGTKDIIERIIIGK